MALAGRGGVLVAGGVAGGFSSVVKAGFLESTACRNLLFVVTHVLIEGPGGKDRQTSFLVGVVLTLTAGLGKIGLGLRLRSSRSVLFPEGFTHVGSRDIWSIVRPSMASCRYALIFAEGGEVVIIEGRRGGLASREAANGT